jgi:hypothetical protein
VDGLEGEIDKVWTLKRQAMKAAGFGPIGLAARRLGVKAGWNPRDMGSPCRAGVLGFIR